MKSSRSIGTQTEDDDMFAIGKCTICTDIMFDARTLVSCGHVYCGTCVTKLSPRRCPECRQGFTITIPSYLVTKLLAERYPTEYDAHMYAKTDDGRIKAMEAAGGFTFYINAEKQVVHAALDMMEVFAKGDQDNTLRLFHELEEKLPDIVFAISITQGTGVTHIRKHGSTLTLISMLGDTGSLDLWTQMATNVTHIVNYHTGYEKSIIRGIKRPRNDVDPTLPTGLAPTIPAQQNEIVDLLSDSENEADNEYPRPLTPAYNPPSPSDNPPSPSYSPVSPSYNPTGPSYNTY